LNLKQIFRKLFNNLIAKHTWRILNTSIQLSIRNVAAHLKNFSCRINWMPSDKPRASCTCNNLG